MSIRRTCRQEPLYLIFWTFVALITWLLFGGAILVTTQLVQLIS